MVGRLGRYELRVDGAAVASGSSCFVLNEEGWQRLEAGASRFEIERRAVEGQPARVVISQEWGASWRRA